MSEQAKLKILVVEDNEDLRRLLMIILTSRGYEVEAVGDGNEAQHRMLNHPNNFDLVISDVGIPGIDGFSLLKFAKDQNKNSKFILMSGNPPETELAQKNPHADDYLVKPFRKDDLLKSVSRLST
jgi:CheY-like chemotaxis protein